MNDLICTLLVGVGATALIDLWAIARKRLLGIPPPDYGLVGRWLGHMVLSRRFRHDRIGHRARFRQMRRLHACGRGRSRLF